MAGFRNVRALVDREATDAANIITSFRKVPAVTTAAGFWMDLSMAPGNPKPQYYFATPLTATPMAQSTDGGIYHGGVVSPATKYLRRLLMLSTVATATPLPLILCDYLMYYTGIDEGELAPQDMTNSVGLSRYTTGAGVQMTAVVIAPHAVGGQTFTVAYTNSAGVSGRTSQTVTMNTQFVNGTLLASAPATVGCRGPWIPLQVGDTGVRSVQSVLVNGIGDVGLFALVLVKPLCRLAIRDITAPIEVDFFMDQPTMPVVTDDAYLNFFCLPAGTINATQITGLADYTFT